MRRTCFGLVFVLVLDIHKKKKLFPNDIRIHYLILKSSSCFATQCVSWTESLVDLLHCWRFREGCLMLKVHNKVCECAILSLLNEALSLGKGYMIESKMICIADTLDH